MGVCILGQGDCNTTTSTDISDITNNDTNINNSIHTQINQDCSQSVLQSNIINIVGSTVKKLTASQKNAIESMCIMQSILKSNVSADVTNKLLDKIKSNVDTKGALLGSTASNNTIINKRSSNHTAIDNSKFNDISKRCILQTSQSNLLNIIGSNVEDTTTDQANQAFLKCLSQHSDDTQIKSSDLTDTKQDTSNTSKTQGGDLGDSIGSAAQGIGSGVSTAATGIGSGASAFISAYTYPIAIALGICCCMCVVLLGIMMMNSGNVSDLANTGSDIYKSYKA
jgi:hypothetical protein